MTVLAWVLVLTTLAAWGATVILARAALVQPYIRFLTAVTAASAIGAIGGTVLLPLVVGVITDFHLDPPWPGVLLVGGILALELPGPIFLVAYLLGWFGNEAGS